MHAHGHAIHPAERVSIHDEYRIPAFQSFWDIFLIICPSAIRANNKNSHEVSLQVMCVQSKPDISLFSCATEDCV